MSSPYPRYTGLSYANVAAGTVPRTSSSDTPLDQSPNVATYAQASYVPATSQPRSIRQPSFERRQSAHTADRGQSINPSLITWQRDSLDSSTMMPPPPPPINRDPSPNPFIPTYLAGSRYANRLKHQHNEQDQTIDALNGHDPQYYSMSTHMHRGVAHKVVERAPYYDYDSKPRPLPSAWSDQDRAPGLEILAEGTEIRLGGIPRKIADEAASIRTDNPIPREVGIYYYEVTVMSRGKDALIGIGFSGKKMVLNRLPGWEAESYAYHGDDGDVYSGSSNGRQFGPKFSCTDIIGCGVNFRTNKIFFTKNGIFLGDAFNDIKPTLDLYPSIGIKKMGENLKANFGRRPFVFDIDNYVRQEARVATYSIDGTGVEKLHPPDDEAALVQNLVSQYLAHEGYVETSRAFLQDLREQRRLAPSTSTLPLPNMNSADDDVHAVNRQRIRQAILHGDMSKALKLSGSCFPQVLPQPRNRDTYFRLRCRRFIEMIGRYADQAVATNGTAYDDYSKDTQMELDDQIQRETLGMIEDTEMDGMTDPSVAGMKQHELLTLAIEYGQGLKAEFEADLSSQRKKDLDEMFALIAYENPRTSPVQHLLNKNERSSIAEELNAAILVSLGQPPSAALERMCSQTEFLLDETVNKVGGAAALINPQIYMHGNS